MKGTEVFRPTYVTVPNFNLTSEPQNRYPRAGVLFMDDSGKELPQGGSTPGTEKVGEAVKAPVSPKRGVFHRIGFKKAAEPRIEVGTETDQARIRKIRQEFAGGPEKHTEELRNEWSAAFAPEELKNPGINTGIENAIATGYGPHSITSKEKDTTKPGAREAIEVVRNTTLSKEDHLKKAQELLGKELSEEQQDALWKAHTNLGSDEVGRDGRQAGLYNLTVDQLKGKADILKGGAGVDEEHALFKEDQRRKIIESGLALIPTPLGGQPPRGPQSVPPLSSSHPGRNQFIEFVLQETSKHIDPNNITEKMVEWWDDFGWQNYIWENSVDDQGKTQIKNAERDWITNELKPWSDEVMKKKEQIERERMQQQRREKMGVVFNIEEELKKDNVRQALQESVLNPNVVFNPNDTNLDSLFKLIDMINIADQSEYSYALMVISNYTTEQEIQRAQANPDLARELREKREGFKIDPQTGQRFIDPTTGNPVPVDPAWMAEEARDYIYEKLLENIVGQPDKHISGSIPYDAALGGGFHIRTNIDNVRNVVFTHSNEKFHGYIANLEYFRKIMYEMNRSLTSPEEYKQFLAQHLLAPGLQFVHNDVVGVDDVLRLYEQLAPQETAAKKQWFDDERAEKIVKRVDTQFRALAENGRVKRRILDENGGLKYERELTEMEIKRALALGLVLTRGLQRFSIYANYGDVEKSSTGRFGSRWGEYLGRAFMTAKMGFGRFAIGKGSQALRRHAFIEQREFDRTLSRRDGDERDWGWVMGASPLEVWTNSIGAPDIFSHSWRKELLNFSNVMVPVVDPISSRVDLTTLRKHLDKKGEDVKNDEELKDKKPGEINHIFSEMVSDVVLAQRLNISALSTYGNFDRETRKHLFEKTAVLRPSFMASLFPEIKSDLSDTEIKKLYNLREMQVTLGASFREGKRYEHQRQELDALENRVQTNSGHWDSLIAKLEIAEMDRIYDDREAQRRFNDLAQRVYVGQTLSPTEQQEFSNFTVKAEAEAQTVKSHYDTTRHQDARNELFNKYLSGLPGQKEWNGAPLTLTQDEKDLLKQVIDKGIKSAEYASIIKFPHVLGNNDLFEVAWDKPTYQPDFDVKGMGDVELGQENLMRFLMDQGKLVEACTPTASVLYNPIKDPEENFVKTIDGYDAVIGRGPAQRLFHGIFAGFYKFTGQYTQDILDPKTLAFLYGEHRPKLTKPWTWPWPVAVRKATGLETSEADHHFRGEGLSFTPEEINERINKLVNHKAVGNEKPKERRSDNPVKFWDYFRRMQSDAELMKKRTKSTGWRKFWRMMWVIFLASSTVGAARIAKSIEHTLPGDLRRR